MSGRTLSTPWALLVLLVASCSPDAPGELTEQQRAAIAQEAHERVSGYCDAVRRRDLAYLHGFWADTPGFALAGDGELLTEHQEIVDATEEWFGGISDVLYCDMTDTRIYVLGPDAASATTNFAWGIRTLQGDTVESYGGWTYVFDRVAGQLRAVHSSGYRQFK